MRDLRGKRALITGAASGIGRAISLRLAREGADVCLLDIDRTGMSAVAEQAAALHVRTLEIGCDVTQSDEIRGAVQHLLETWQAIDILVNNAGVAYYGPTLKMSESQWQWLLAINLHAPIQFTRELLPTLLQRDSAHVVNIASVAGLVAGGRFCAYHVSKFGLVGFTEALRAEFGRSGLGVSAICPGPVLTQLYRSAPCGHEHKSTPTPPRFICTTPERVAASTLRAIRRDKGLVLVSPLARVLYYTKRFAPGLVDRVHRIGRRRKIRRRLAAARATPSSPPSTPHGDRPPARAGDHAA